jgi:ABC-type transporter Mla subunit MlaD
MILSVSFAEWTERRYDGVAAATDRATPERKDTKMQTDAITQAEQIVERQKEAGANRASEMAKAVHGAADEIGKEMPQAAELVHSAASRLEQSADAVRERNLRDLVGTFGDMGRKEPLALFGGAMVAGFAISRFLKSSSTESHRGD